MGLSILLKPVSGNNIALDPILPHPPLITLGHIETIRPHKGLPILMSTLHNVIGLLFAQPHHKVQSVRYPFFCILFVVMQYEMPLFVEEHVFLNVLLETFDGGCVGY